MVLDCLFVFLNSSQIVIVAVIEFNPLLCLYAQTRMGEWVGLPVELLPELQMLDFLNLCFRFLGTLVSLWSQKSV